MTWNSLPDNLRDPTLSADKFRAALKTHFLFNIRTCSALEASCVIARYKCTIPYCAERVAYSKRSWDKANDVHVAAYSYVLS